MFVSAFTFAKNAVLFDYPVKEAILSVLPICDEIIVLVGDCEDGTLELVSSINDPKIKIYRSIWNATLREGGKVLADETNKAFAYVDKRSDWVIYIQADECLHENSHAAVLNTMRNCLQNQNIEGLLVDFVHFYGSYDYVGDSPRWYRKEIRIIRNNPKIESYKDAQGFRIDGRKLRVNDSGGIYHHYGWVKHPNVQKLKQKEVNKLWHDDNWIETHIGAAEAFDYGNIDSLKHFAGSHPQVIQQRIQRINWHFDFDPTKRKLNFKYRLKLIVEKLFGFRPGEYKNYTKI